MYLLMLIKIILITFEQTEKALEPKLIKGYERLLLGCVWVSDANRVFKMFKKILCFHIVLIC